MKKVTIPSSVTEIGEYAFKSCKKITEIEIPDSVTKIKWEAFKDCSDLTNVKLSKSLTEMWNSTFANCNSLTEIEIPKSLDKVSTYGFASEGAFANCDNLKTVRFEEGTTQIAINLFNSCTGLEEIEIPNTVTNIEASAFANCNNLKKVTIPSSVTVVEGYAFYKCTQLADIILSNSLETIGENTFAGCISLTEIIIPDSVTSIGNYAFTDCTALANVKLPNTRKNITDGMFRNCTALKNITLPESVTRIAGSAFYNSGLETIKLSSNLQTIESYAFRKCVSLKSITIPDSVTSIGSYCFAECDNLSEITLGNGLTKIEQYTFNLCPSIQKVILPYRMTSVAANAFTNCTKLTELVIPRGMTSIADNAFSYPKQMTVYGVPGTYAETWASSVGAQFVSQEKHPETVQLSNTEITLNNGKTYTLTISVTPKDFTDEINWKSSNTAIATVSDTGVVTAKGIGTATIRVIVGNMSASCKVIVVQPVTSISLNKSKLSMTAGETEQLTASAYPENATDKTVIWRSSDETVATVDASGKVTALKKGNAVITATANDGSGVTGNCNVTVTSTIYHCDIVDELESRHNYENNCKDIWIYTLEGTSQLKITFDDRTYMEDDFDYLYLYDANDKEIGKYTGDSLAGRTIVIEGDTIKIKMDSDGSGNEWGFKVTKAEGDYVPVSIIKHPQNQEVEEGKTVIFTVKAEGSGLSYQWQVSKNGGKTWSNTSLGGNKTETLPVTGSRSRDGYLFRCVITDKNGKSITTESAKLIITGELEITGQPADQEVEEGKTAKFVVAATGNGLSYQWQVSKNGGKTWSNTSLGGNKTETLPVTGSRSRDGYLFRCVITDKNGKSITTESAKLIITGELEITGQPADQEVEEGKTAKFVVAATGNGLSYQWQVSKNGGKTWSNTSLGGNKTETLQVTASKNRYGYQFHCVVTDENGNSVTTESVVLNVIVEAPSETEHDYEVTSIVDATCTEGGYTLETCKNCGDTRKVNETQATGHDDGEWVITQEAELGVVGSQELKCTKCQEILDTQEIPMLTTDGTDSVYYFTNANGEQEMVIGHYNDEEEQEMFNLVNEYRASKGLDSYEFKIGHMNEYTDLRGVETSYLWDHTRPAGWGCEYSENIAMGPVDGKGNTPSVEQIFEAWINSTGHRNNIEGVRSKNWTCISAFYKRYPVYKDGVETGQYVYQSFWVETFK